MKPEIITGMVFNIMRFSTQDGPGLRTTVFLKGCPLSCGWCHNPESQGFRPHVVFRAIRCIGCGACAEACVHGAITLENGCLKSAPELCRTCGACVEACPTEARDLIGREMTVAQVMTEILKDLPFYEESGGGVTFSGGEPLAQPEFLRALLEACRAEAVPTAVDTSGSAPWAAFESIQSLVDLYLYDLKIMDEPRHRTEIGGNLDLVLSNLARLAAGPARVWVRVPIIPGVNDDEGNLAALADFLEKLPRIQYIFLLPYHGTGVDKYRLLGRDYALDQVKVPEPEALENMAAWLRERGLPASVGGK